MQVSGKSEELYDELARQIDARDDTAARRLFQELLNSGRSRQEIVIQVSRLIEKRSAGKTVPIANEETRWLKPHLSIRPSASGDRNHLNASADTPLSSTQHRFDTSAEQSASRRDVGLERRPLSVPERLASKLQLQTQQTMRTELQARQVGPVVPAEIEARQTIPPEAKVKDRSKLTLHGSPALSRTLRTVLAGASAMTTALAGLLVLSLLYGNEEVSVANAKHVLTWLQAFNGANLSASLDSSKPAASTTQSEQATGVYEDSELPKRLEASADHPPASDSTPRQAGADNALAATGSAATKVEADAGAISTQASSQTSEKAPSRIGASSSQLTERAVSPSTPANSARQNETEAVQRPQTGETQHPAVDTGSLIAQGDQFLSKPDVASARLLYQRAAEAGDGRGALRMGMTFDPVFLARWRLRGVRADRTRAIAWYRHANALGNADAELMQRTNRGTDDASRSTPGAAGQNAAPRGRRTSHGSRGAPATQNAKRG